MTGVAITGRTVVAGVVGAPIAHSLSPVIHNTWLGASNHHGVYVPFSPDPMNFERFVDGLRGGALVGLNVTLPFKERAFAIADRVDDAAQMAGSANLLLFHPGGAICARNTDGIGLMSAFAEKAPGWRPSLGPVVVLGAGGAARGAVAALMQAGAQVRVVNRTPERARDLCAKFTGLTALSLDELGSALCDAGALVNAAPLDPRTSETVVAQLDLMPAQAVVMDMIYTPLETALLAGARRLDLRSVDGLDMLIGQGRPSFEALFGLPPPTDVDVRGAAEQALGDR